MHLITFSGLSITFSGPSITPQSKDLVSYSKDHTQCILRTKHHITAKYNTTVSDQGITIHSQGQVSHHILRLSNPSQSKDQAHHILTNTSHHNLRTRHQLTFAGPKIKSQVKNGTSHHTVSEQGIILHSQDQASNHILTTKTHITFSGQDIPSQ